MVTSHRKLSNLLNCNRKKSIYCSIYQFINHPTWICNRIPISRTTTNTLFGVWLQHTFSGCYEVITMKLTPSLILVEILVMKGCHVSQKTA